MSARRRGLARIALAVVLGLFLCIGLASRSQAQACPNPYLCYSQEIDPSHPEISSKAQELATPLAAFVFVRNEIEFQVYYGSKKGALGTLRSGSGNDFDQASLLIALLRAQGIPARYVLGVVDVDMDQLEQWSGTRDGDTAGKLFEYHYCNNDMAFGACGATPKLFELVRSSTAPFGVVSARMEHAWVEAELPARYRGLAVDGAAPTWLPMDPSWKQKAYRDPIPLPIGNEVLPGGCAPPNDLCFEYNDYYSKVETRTAAEIWEQQIQDWLGAQPEGAVPPGATAEDAIYDGPIIPFQDEVLPLSLPFIPEAVPAVFSVADIGELTGVERRFFVFLGLCYDGPDDGTVPCDNLPDEWLGVPAVFVSAALAGRRITFAFPPYGDSAQSAWLQFGGPFGSWPNTSGSVLEYCATVAGSDQRCHVADSLMIDGVEVWTSPFFYSMGLNTPPSIYTFRDVIPGLGLDISYPVEFTDHVGIGVDVDQAGPREFRNRTEALLDTGRQLKLVDEGDGDTNENTIFGELLLDQGSDGITPCPTFDVSDPSDPWNTCDIALDAKFPTASGPGYDAVLGELLHISAARFFERLGDQHSRVLSLDGFYREIPPNVGISRAGRSYTYLFGRAIGVEPGAPILDIQSAQPFYVDIDGDPDPSFARNRRELRLWGHIGSAFEHLVWEELVGTEFVSTVKGIQLVKERFPAKSVQFFSGTPSSTVNTILGGFRFDTISGDTIAEIAGFAADPNHTATTPIAAVTSGASPLEVYVLETHKTTPPVDIRIGMRIRAGDQTAGGSCQLQECGGLVEGEEPPGLLDLFLVLLSRLRAISIGEVDADASLPPAQDPSGVSETLAGDPVSMVSGNLHHTEQDLVLPTDGPPFSLARTYNSQIDDAGVLGVGWMHSYEMRVEPAQDTRVFTYLPTALSGFANLSQVAGPRSDTLDTSNVGGGTETVTWGVLPPAFTTAVQEVESIDLELAYSGNESTVTPNTGQLPVTLPATGGSPFAFKTVELKNGAGDPYVSLASPIEVTFGSFNSADRLFYARLRIRYRGPTIERVPLVAVETGFTGWADGGAALRDDEDPSSCSHPTGDQATISYQSPGVLDGIFGHELIVSVDRTPTTGSRTSTVYRGTPAAGEAFATGPVVGGKGARQRFMTTNITEQLVVTFDREVGSSGTPENQLCLVSYRALTMPQQVEFVREDGARERFVKRAGVWEAAPGVRSQLAEIVDGYQITRVDGQILRFEQDDGSGGELLTRVSDPQGRSLDLSYVGALLDKVSWANSPSPEPEALQFHYANGYLDYVEDWSVPNKRRWDFNVDANGDLREVRDPVESSNLPNPLTGTTYDYLFDQANEKLDHNLLRITFPKDVVAPAGGDHRVEFEYDNSDRVISQTDLSESSIVRNRQTFAYNVAGQESQTTDPRGFTTVYRYDTQANLTQRADPDGAVWTWAYDGDRNVTSETDPFGKTRYFSGHDERGKPATIVDRDGRSIQLTYDPDSGAPASITDKRSNVRTTQFSQGQPVQVTATLGAAAPLLIENQYDPATRRLDKIFQPFGDGSGREAITVFSYFPGNRDIQFIDSWEDDGDRVLGGPQDERLSRTEFEYDALGRRRAQTIQRAKAPNDPSPIPIRTEVERNLRGQIERVIRPDGATWFLEYDRNGNLEAQFLQVTGPKGTLSVHQRLDFRYDVLDRLEEVEDARGGITRFEYDAAGNRIATVDPKGNRSRIEYDSKNRPVRRIDANGAVTTTEYDAAGRVVSETDPTGVTTRLSYDEIGLLASLQEGGSKAAMREVVYDDPAPGDLRHELIDPNENLTTFVFDDLGRITQVTDAGTPAGLTQIEYDLHGNLTRFTDPEGGETRFVFDAAGRVEEDQPPYATGPYTTDYDETGNATRVTKPDGCQIEMTYDKMGRVVDRISTASCPPGVIGIHDRFGYDARGNLVVAKNAQVALIREFDELDRLVREIDSRFGTAVGYVYDAASRVTGVVYPDGSVAHLAYDPAGRTTGITDPFRDTTRYSYDAAGRRVQTRGMSGLETDLRYDADGRLELIESRRTDSSLAARHEYSAYDDAGNRGQLVDGFGTTVYAYDALQRLEAVTPPGQSTRHFEYDRAGNRTRSGNQVSGSWTTYTDYFYDNQPGDVTHRITSVESNTGAVLHAFPIYDPNGNPTQWDFGSPRTLRWDALGRLAAIEGGFTGTYAYDPFGRRIAKTEQGATVRYQYDGLDAVAEYDGAGALQATYVYGPGIDEPIKIERGGTVAAFHGDGLGSIVAVSDVDAPAGVDLASYRYEPFGADAGTTGGFEHPYGFTGRERDASGLYYYRARYYLPAIGRFLTPDPIGLAGGVNPYSYVNSNPVNFRDPFGLVPGERGSNETTPTIPESQRGLIGPIPTPEDADVAERLLIEFLNAALKVHYYLVEEQKKFISGEFCDPEINCGVVPLLPTTRARLLSRATDPRVRDLIKELYRRNARIGSGSSMDAYRREGSHLEKLFNRQKQALDLWRDPKLSGADRSIVREILIDIQNALGGN